jgi:hypothetical protein
MSGADKVKRTLVLPGIGETFYHIYPRRPIDSKNCVFVTLFVLSLRVSALLSQLLVRRLRTSTYTEVEAFNSSGPDPA